MNNIFKAEFASNISDLEEIYTLVHESLACKNVSEKIMKMLQICIEEIFVNICSYAYGDETGPVEISIEVLENAVKISFSDKGTEFNPLLNKDPNIAAGADERRIGGLGIFMVKNMMNNVSYRYENNCNILTIEKDF